MQGQIIDDLWVIEKALGTGGMGSVYRAHNQHAPKIRAAIKILNAGLSLNEHAKIRFVREAEILHGLDHPHIVKVRNIRLDSAQPYIEMEFVEGESLYRVIQGGPMGFARALLYAEQLASAVRYLHRHNVFHRDIKPANLIIRKGAFLKLVDFGLAVDVGDDAARITADHSHFGTAAYAPPEWIKPSTMTARLWDIYAIGVVLAEMLTGLPAYDADPLATPQQAAIEVMTTKNRQPFLDIGDRFPEPIRELVRDLTARDPADRIQDARDIVLRLQQIQAELALDANTVLESNLSGDELQIAVQSRQLEIDRQPTGAGAPRRSPQEPQLAPSAPADPPPSKRMWVWGGALVTLLAVAGASGVVAAALLASFAWWSSPDVPEDREVALLLTGIPRGVDARVRVGEREQVRRDGLQAYFDPMPPGHYDVQWAVGAGCDIPDCPGAACPSWCEQGEASLDVEVGNGLADLTLEVHEASPHTVTVPLLAGSPTNVKGRLAGRTAEAHGGLLSFPEVPPGSHLLLLYTSDCPESAFGCSSAGECPDGCSSRATEVTVPASGDFTAPAIAIAPPKPAKPAPTTGPRPSISGKPVTRAAYAAWLTSNPDWSIDAARTSGKADSSYLQGVDLSSKSGSPVTSVPWAAASAFCAGKGGLAPLGAAPTTWDEKASVFQEWRVDGSTPVWLRYDGASSPQLSRAAANAFTGFRCSR